MHGYIMPKAKCENCNTILSHHSKINDFITCPLEKIYFTVQIDQDTYYFESDCQESLQTDIQGIMFNVYIENEIYEDWIEFSDSCHITFSNQLPKGILL